MNPHDFPANVTRIKASYQREDEMPVSMEPTLAERFAYSWLAPIAFVAACFLCAAVIVYAVR